MGAPGTCHAAWLAVDDADAGNGSLFVVPGSHRRAIASTRDGTADRWGTITPRPAPAEQVEVRMRAGDCLFFHGSLVHGSQRNDSTERWRRSFICHYVGARECDRVAAYYHPILRADGAIADIGAELGLPPGWAPA